MTVKAHEILVTNVALTDDRTVQCSLEFGATAARFFSGEPFFARYDRSVRDVPPGILAIPLLASLCPVAWIAGADVFVDRLDRKFYLSLERAKEAFAGMYPKLKFSGKLRVGTLTDDEPAVHMGRTAALFSGGVDSLGTFLRRKAENPYLITVWGADVPFSRPEIWNEVKRYNETFGRSHGLESLFIESNLRGILNEEHISFHCGRVTGGWWAGVQHGLGLSGLCAPLAFALGIGLLFVPSALPPKLAVSVPDGSNTLICNRVEWAGTGVRLDAEEMTRQDKVAAIAAHMRDSGQDLTVRVCWTNTEYGNCGRCEKCLRTIAALLAEGVDPVRAGFPVGEDSYAEMRRLLPKWMSSNDELKIEYWKEIRDRSVRNFERLRPEDIAFFRWLQELPVRPFKRKLGLRDALIDKLPHPLFLALKKIVLAPAGRKAS